MVLRSELQRLGVNLALWSGLWLFAYSESKLTCHFVVVVVVLVVVGGKRSKKVGKRSKKVTSS